MRCEDAVTEIGSSLAGELEPEAEVRLQDHLAGCGELPGRVRAAA